ncbi:MAG: flavodoxin family protein [Synergistaceae bacterium]|jgi:multimeric flavodoxin WrbA|nr:flavodoxin family protein [Synergistaceae bacterium]
MVLVITASPNTGGLTAACGRAALEGIERAGKTGEIIDLCAERIQGCLVCGDGWGSCREEHRCVIDDGFASLQARLGNVEGLVLVTPVYWGQQSERVKYFRDRLRRCEARRGSESVLAGKKINLVAAAGGTGNGTVSCLTDMELWCRHMSAIPFERIGVTRFNRGEMLSVIGRASVALVENISA